MTPPANLINSNTDVMLVEFSKPMSTVGLFATSNYTIIDENGVNVPVSNVEVINNLDGIAIPQTTLVALVIPKQENRKTFTITVRNVRALDNTSMDLQKNTFWYFHNGYAPNLEQSPKLIFK